jgi:hypothetical protein
MIAVVQEPKVEVITVLVCEGSLFSPTFTFCIQKTYGNKWENSEPHRNKKHSQSASPTAQRATPEGFNISEHRQEKNHPCSPPATLVYEVINGLFAKSR